MEKLPEDGDLIAESLKTPLPTPEPHPLDRLTETFAWIRGHFHMGQLNLQQAEDLALTATVSALGDHPTEEATELRMRIITDFVVMFGNLPDFPIRSLAEPLIERYVPRDRAADLLACLPKDPAPQP